MKKITVNGKTQSLAAHCRDFDKPYKTVYARIYQYKWSIGRALRLTPSSQKSIIERIYEKTICDIKTQCWNWTGHLIQGGYGTISINNKIKYIHRIIYEYFYGPIPEDKPLILHRCDNPKCCNPMHLYAGTDQDNMNDKRKRNRCNSVYGEKNGRAKFTEKQILEIRKSKELLIVLAKRFNVSYSTIQKIKNRKTWKHI